MRIEVGKSYELPSGQWVKILVVIDDSDIQAKLADIGGGVLGTHMDEFLFGRNLCDEYLLMDQALRGHVDRESAASKLKKIRAQYKSFLNKEQLDGG